MDPFFIDPPGGSVESTESRHILWSRPRPPRRGHHVLRDPHGTARLAARNGHLFMRKSQGKSRENAGKMVGKSWIWHNLIAIWGACSKKRNSYHEIAHCRLQDRLLECSCFSKPGILSSMVISERGFQWYKQPIVELVARHSAGPSVKSVSHRQPFSFLKDNSHPPIWFSTPPMVKGPKMSQDDLVLPPFLDPWGSMDPCWPQRLWAQVARSFAAPTGPSEALLRPRALGLACCSRMKKGLPTARKHHDFRVFLQKLGLFSFLYLLYFASS